MKIFKMIPFRWSLVAILFLAIQSQAWAHAFLDHADPKVGSTITNSPPIIKIWFTQNLEPVFASVHVLDAQGKQVDKRDSHLDSQDKTLVIVSLPKLPGGTYTVTWHVVSVDTHRTQGSFEFTIKTAQK
ncbi:MAG TPA: copper resistance CopC family protein [Candidatus Acidoferrales bacterium]|jgi:methionine-rich copper-binding protein CopC|nr:copper resistance CopC family protein [Candidatus Acidoferrales bacterium]